MENKNDGYILTEFVNEELISTQRFDNYKDAEETMLEEMSKVMNDYNDEVPTYKPIVEIKKNTAYFGGLKTKVQFYISELPSSKD